MDVTMDTSELGTLAADLGRGGARMVRETRAVVTRGAVKVRDGARDRVRGIAHAPAYPDAITFDVFGLTAEIGPDKDRRQGALGNILEYGTAKNAPIPHLGPALDAEESAFLEQLGVVAARNVL